MRWNHRTRGSISPTVFIPPAEESGRIVPIGRWVLEQACTQARNWQDKFPGRAQLNLSVNVSPIQLGREDFVQNVERILGETGVRPGSITLEITESALMEDTDASTAALG